MARMKVTSHDVARKAGVSRTTVSYVLNNVETGISPATAERVRQAALELGYVPNAAGRALAGQKTKNIGFFCLQEHLTHPHVLKILSGLNEVTRRHRLRLLLDTYVESPGGGSLLALSRERSVDGLILFETKESDRELSVLLEENFPVVVMGRYPGALVSSVDVDLVEAGYKATRHLIDLGHSDIGFISNAPVIYTASSGRMEGFRNAMNDAGLEIRSEWLLTGSYSSQSGYDAGLKLLECSALPTALFVAADTVAYGVIKALSEGGVQCPRGISVMGFDNDPLGPHFIPSLSTIHFDGFESGRIAAEMLVNLIEGRSRAGECRLLETVLMQRESTRPLVS